jgi:uncharacterized OB-fold protein
MTTHGHPPRISKTSEPFWTALRRERIVIQQCDDCNRWVFYPRLFCPHCSGTTLSWNPVSGGATLYSYSVAERPVSAAFKHLDRPVLAIVELDEGVRLPSRIVDVDPDAVTIGMPLAPVFDHETYQNATLLLFKPR